MAKPEPKPTKEQRRENIDKAKAKVRAATPGGTLGGTGQVKGAVSRGRGGTGGTQIVFDPRSGRTAVVEATAENLRIIEAGRQITVQERAVEQARKQAQERQTVQQLKIIQATQRKRAEQEAEKLADKLNKQKQEFTTLADKPFGAATVSNFAEIVRKQKEAKLTELQKRKEETEETRKAAKKAAKERGIVVETKIPLVEKVKIKIPKPKEQLAPLSAQEKLQKKQIQQSIQKVKIPEAKEFGFPDFKNAAGTIELAEEFTGKQAESATDIVVKGLVREYTKFPKTVGRGLTKITKASFKIGQESRALFEAKDEKSRQNVLKNIDQIIKDTSSDKDVQTTVITMGAAVTLSALPAALQKTAGTFIIGKEVTEATEATLRGRPERLGQTAFLASIIFVPQITKFIKATPKFLNNKYKSFKINREFQKALNDKYEGKLVDIKELNKDLAKISKEVSIDIRGRPVKEVRIAERRIGADGIEIAKGKAEVKLGKLESIDIRQESPDLYIIRGIAGKRARFGGRANIKGKSTLPSTAKELIKPTGTDFKVSEKGEIVITRKQLLELLSGDKTIITDQGIISVKSTPDKVIIESFSARETGKNVKFIEEVGLRGEIKQLKINRNTLKDIIKTADKTKTTRTAEILKRLESKQAQLQGEGKVPIQLPEGKVTDIFRFESAKVKGRPISQTTGEFFDSNILGGRFAAATPTLRALAEEASKKEDIKERREKARTERREEFEIKTVEKRQRELDKGLLEKQEKKIFILEGLRGELEPVKLTTKQFRNIIRKREKAKDIDLIKGLELFNKKKEKARREAVARERAIKRGQFNIDTLIDNLEQLNVEGKDFLKEQEKKEVKNSLSNLKIQFKQKQAKKAKEEKEEDIRERKIEAGELVTILKPPKTEQKQAKKQKLKDLAEQKSASKKIQDFQQSIFAAQEQLFRNTQKQKIQFRQEQKQEQRQRQRQKQEQKQKQRQEIIIASMVKQEQEQKQKAKQKVTPIVGQKIVQEPIQEPAEDIISAQKVTPTQEVVQDIVQETVQEPIQEQIFGTPGEIFKPPKIPKEPKQPPPPPIKIELTKKRIKKEKERFQSQVRIKGEFKTIAKPKSKESAYKIGRKNVRETSTASLRVTDSKGQVQSPRKFKQLFPQNEFRESKKDIGVIIERKNRRITRGTREIAEITRKGIAATKIKGRRTTARAKVKKAGPFNLF